MTAYVAIADSEIDPESPYTTTLATKMRDNPIAITEKASGAPVLANNYVVNAMIAAEAVDEANIVNATSGTTYRWGGCVRDLESSTTSITYLKIDINTAAITVLRAGTFTCRWEHKTDTGVSYTRIYKNGVATGVIKSNNTTSFVTETDILTFATGDIIELYQRTGGGVEQSIVKNFELMSSIKPLG